MKTRRFTIRTLLILIAVVAALTNWFAAPSRVATRYAMALNSGDYKTATDLCVGEMAFPFEVTAGFETHALVAPLSLDQVWHGQRDINVYVNYETGEGGMASYGVLCHATRKGIRVATLIP